MDRETQRPPRLPGPGWAQPCGAPGLRVPSPPAPQSCSPHPAAPPAQVSLLTLLTGHTRMGCLFPLGCTSPLLGAQVLPIRPVLLQQGRLSRTPTSAFVIVLVFIDLCSEHLLLFIPFGLAFTSYTRLHMGVHSHTGAADSSREMVVMGIGSRVEPPPYLVQDAQQAPQKASRWDLSAAGLCCLAGSWEHSDHF